MFNNKNISKQQIRYYSTNKEIIYKVYNLNPWWVTGFVDAEGSFSMSKIKSKTAAIGWTIEPCFIITLHVRDLELLYYIKNFFSVGLVSIVGTYARYRVRSRSELKIIIAHFNKYPLQTTKVVNFLYFCEILNLINNKVHTNISGFLKLASLINKLNKPLSESLLTKLVELGPLPKVEFESSSNSPYFPPPPPEHPLFPSPLSRRGEKGYGRGGGGNSFITEVKTLNPWWLSGFATGEGSFTYFTRTLETLRVK